MVRGWSDGVGEDSVAFAEFAWRGFGYDLTLASGYGSLDNRCHHSWLGVEYGITTCFDAAGNPVDAKIDILHVRPVAVPEPGHFAMLASGIALTGLFARRRSRQGRAL